MPEISLDIPNESFEIGSYNGNSAQMKIYQLSSSPKEFPFTQRWNFFRQGDNHAYVGRNVYYNGDCRNNLIISPYRNNKLVNVRNAFVLVKLGNVEISPMSNIHNAINKGKKALSNQGISYNIPLAVFERENLGKKDLGELRKETEQRYEIEIDRISVVSCGRTNNGIWYIADKRGKEYILKFRGRNKEKAELLSQITQDIHNYFPLNFRRKDNNDFTFKIGDELYGLEEFVEASYQKPRNMEYFSLLGHHIGLLHNLLLNFLKKNKKIETMLDSTPEYTSESNLVSLYLDLSADELRYKPLISVLEMIIEEELNHQMSSFPKGLIHGDLNHSNLIWQESNPKIVDSETIKISNRLNEFGSPLLFDGNMEKPKYVKGSLKIMTCSYNRSIEVPLSKEERRILPFLLRHAILRNFVVRKIRRGINDEHYLSGTIENLKLIEEDSL